MTRLHTVISKDMLWQHTLMVMAYYIMLGHGHIMNFIG